MKCKQCEREMVQGKRVEKSLALQVVGIFVFLIGIALLFVFPFGTIVGVVLIPVSLFLGHKKVRVWKCSNCGYYFDRV